MKKTDVASQEAEYDEIVRKLDALLSRHKRENSASTESAVRAVMSPAPLKSSATETSLTANDNIPTLTETVQVTPSMLSSHTDIRSLLWQVLDSALKDTGADLDTATRNTLVQALESRLFSV